MLGRVGPGKDQPTKDATAGAQSGTGGPKSSAQVRQTDNPSTTGRPAMSITERESG